MFEKKKLVLNCDVCDTRKMKEEDYSSYEHVVINADVVIVNETSKSILNRLPLTLNHDKMIELANEVDAVIKVVNGSYKITGTNAAQNHTILIVNGPLEIEPGTEELLEKYEQIMVNGPVNYPKSLDSLLTKMTVNGSVSTYPDDCVVLDEEFTIDKYFPLRAKEGSRYYVKEAVIIKDRGVDIARLAQKNVQFVTSRFIVPECKIEDSIPLFDEQVEFVVVPEGMELVYGDSFLNEELIRKEGNRLFVYGNLEVDEAVNMNTLCEMLEKLVVKGTLTLRKGQEEAFRSVDAEYDKLVIARNSRKLTNMIKAKLDKNLFDNSPEGIEVFNVAKIVIADDVTPEMIFEKLVIENCAKVDCSEMQESAVSAISTNVAKIGEASSDENEMGAGDVFSALKGLADTKIVNAYSYVM